MKLLNRIKEIGDSRGLTIAQIERGSGLNKTTLAKWNINSPSIDKVIAVADFFGISVDELIGRTPPVMSKSERALLDLLGQLNDDGQNVAIKQLQFLCLQPEYIKSDLSKEMEG